MNNISIEGRLKKIDLHMHTNISDGTDTPEIIIENVKKAGIKLFSVTDHDSIKSSRIIPDLLDGDLLFISGVEFSCKDEEGQYHILGYGYDPEAVSIKKVVDMGHSYRIEKVISRLDFLKKEFNVIFPDDEITNLLALDNPGKPHIGNLMAKYGYAESKEQAIKEYINKKHFHNEYVRPEEAIEGILNSGGIPVLAHPCYGSGDDLILGADMDRRLRKLIGYGLKGVEGFYSGFTDKLRREILRFAELYGLYVTAGSDYHGSNKMIKLGDTELESADDLPDGLLRFLDDTKDKLSGKLQNSR